MRRRLIYPLLFIVVAALGGLAAVVATDSSPELGLDLQGGVSVVLEPTRDVDAGQLDIAVDIIRSRVDALGVAEPEIVRRGDAIEVQLPGVDNRERVLELVGQTAELRFRPVLSTYPGPNAEEAEGEGEGEGEGEESTTTTAEGETTTSAGGESTTTTAAPSGFAANRADRGSAGLPQQGDTTTTTAAGDTTTTAPPTDTTAPAGTPEVTPRDDDAEADPVNLLDKEGTVLYGLGPTLAKGTVVSSASAEIEDQSGQWIVTLNMRGGANGIDKFNEAAQKCYVNAPDMAVCPTGQLAIVLDSVVESAPTINAPSYGQNDITISSQGGMSESEAKDLAVALRYGSLPVELERQNVETISATLGEDSLRAGVIAGLVGLILVAGYMVFYYRALGLVVILGMAVWGSLLFAIVCWLGSSQGLALTLAGVTGIIVSVGITVDSYVVYFERLKDEVRSGRTLRTSTERAFKRAFRTILAADISSFLGAAVLWWLTVGSVRGFALFLGLSTMLDVIVAWFFTRPVVTLLSRNRLFTEARFLGVARGLAAPASSTASAPAGGSGR